MTAEPLQKMGGRTTTPRRREDMADSGWLHVHPKRREWGKKFVGHPRRREREGGGEGAALLEENNGFVATQKKIRGSRAASRCFLLGVATRPPTILSLFSRPLIFSSGGCAAIAVAPFLLLGWSCGHSYLLLRWMQSGPPQPLGEG